MIQNPILPGFNPDPSICRKGDDFYIAVTDWCNSLKITLEQLAFAFVEFVCIKENRDVVIPWMKELQNEQS